MNSRKIKLISILLVILIIAIALIYLSTDNNGKKEISNASMTFDEDGDFTISLPYTAGTGYIWNVSPESHGVELESEKTVEDHPGLAGSSGTDCFTFHPTQEDYYVKLVLVSPSGETVDEVDTKMLDS